MRFVISALVVALSAACSDANNGSPHQAPHDDKEAKARAAEVNQPHAVIDQPFDLRFLDTMSEHHQQGIAMADLALAKASHDELKQFAARMKADQAGQVGAMRKLRQDSFFNANVAVDHALPGMAAMPKVDTKTLERATGAGFDRDFIDTVIAHHQSAVAMANDAADRSTLASVRAMAAAMADAQAREIALLQTWRTTWFGP